jgi:GAF domain-containing protein
LGGVWKKDIVVSAIPDLKQQKNVLAFDVVNVNLSPDTDQLRDRVAELELLNRQLLDDRERSEELADKSRERLELLVQAYRMLASSLDYQATLQNIADLCVLKLADWCTVEIAEENTEEPWRVRPQQAALAHKDPAQIRWAREITKELEARYPYDPDAPTGIPNVLRTGKSEIYPVLTDEMLSTMIEDDYLRKIMLRVGYRSVMIVPITSRDRILGVIQFISTRDEQHYGEADLALAEELARQAGIAIDNSRLYQAARQAVQLRDEFLPIAAHELKTPITSLKITITLGYDYSEIPAEQGGMLRPSVLDNGIGVAPQNREQLFQRFYQVRQGTYNSGMGLALYISQQIAHLHGGRLTAEFPPEGGSLFSLIIPAKSV